LAFRRDRTSNKIRGERGPKAEKRPADEEKTSGGSDRESNNKEQSSQRVMKAALNILAARSYSEGQLRDRLSAKGWSETGLVEDCIKKLKELGYVNDDRFAHGYANYRVSAKPLGRARLTRELAFKKVARSSIDGALDAVFGESGEEPLIDRAIARRLRTHGRPADRAAAKRLFDHLARLGFEYDLIVRKLSGLRTNTDKE
jgi:regulatory protein